MRMRIAFVTILLVGIASASPIQAQGNKRVRAAKLFDKGVSSMEKLDFKTALESFQAAYDISPHWAVLAHIGSCYAKTNRPVRAINALERYLEEGGSDISTDERISARKMLSEQRKKVGTLNLIVMQKGAEAKIDGDSIGAAPFDPALLLAGPHHVIVVLEKEVVERDIQIVAGREHTMKIPGDKPTAAMAPIPKPTPQREPSPSTATDQQPLQEPPPAEPSYNDPTQIDDQSTEQFDLGQSDEELDEHPNGVSVPFFVALGFTGIGIITAGVGWGTYGYYSDSADNYAQSLEEPIFATKSYDEICADWDDPSADVEKNKVNKYFCDNEWKRRDYDSRADSAKIVGIIGSATAVVAGGTALLFYFHPEWFSSNDESIALSIHPYASQTENGLVLRATF